MANNFISGVVELLFPGSCVLCGEKGTPQGVGTSSLAAYLCPSCILSLLPLRPPHCTICSLPFEGVGPSHPCPACAATTPPFDLATSWGPYEGTLKRLILKLKYGGDLYARGALITLFIERCVEIWGEGSEFEMVISVPPSASALKARGFDLPAILARKVANHWNIPWSTSFLKRVGGAEKMAGLGLKERKKAVRGLYEVSGEVNGSILLVDDVVTSMETVKSCARLLKKGGAASVSVASLARTSLIPRKA